MVQDDMVDHNRARPVSGEIMSVANFHDGTTRRHDIQDACDAQFETLGVATKTPTARANMAAPLIPGPVAAGMNFLTQRSATTRENGRPGSLLFWSAGISCIALTFWVSGGHALLMSQHGLSPAASKKALQIASVESRVEAMQGRKILFVDGHAENHATMALPLPAIEIAVTGNDGRVIRYHLGDREPQLAPGSRYEFSSRLQAPDAGVKTVSVAFAEEEH